MRSILVVCSVLVACSGNDGAGDTSGSVVSQICSAEVVDYGPDGEPASFTYEVYDAAGRLVRREHDRNADGENDVVDTRQYDEAGNLVHEESRDRGGALLSVYDATWTGDGRLATEHRSDDGDPDLDGITRFWTRDDHGNALSLDIDVDEDGTIDEHGVYAYDVLGRRTRYTTDDGHEEITVYTAPLLERGTTTTLEDGVVVRIDGFGRDADGREVYAAEDTDLETPGWDTERWTVWNGDRKAIERVEGPDWMTETTWTRDDLGREIMTLTETTYQAQTTEYRVVREFGDACPRG